MFKHTVQLYKCTVQTFILIQIHIIHYLFKCVYWIVMKKIRILLGYCCICSDDLNKLGNKI